MKVIFAEAPHRMKALEVLFINLSSTLDDILEDFSDALQIKHKNMEKF